KEQTDVAIDLEYGQPYLSEMLDALLAQFHEEFVVGNVQPLETVDFVQAVANQGHGFAFHPIVKAAGTLHGVGGRPVEQKNGGEHRDGGQNGGVLVVDDVAGGRTQRQDDDQLEYGQLTYAATA